MGACRNTLERSNIHITGILEKKEREYGWKHIWRDIDGDFPKNDQKIKSHFQEVLETPIIINSKQTKKPFTSIENIVTLIKTKDKERLLKLIKEIKKENKKMIALKKAQQRFRTDFLIDTMEDKR